MVGGLVRFVFEMACRRPSGTIAGVEIEHVMQSSGAGLLAPLGLALALGLRHALDPDHLSAVATITASEAGNGARRAMRIGLAWGLGHALTLLVLGIPVVVAGPWIPPWIHATAEVAIGALIVLLAVRLLVRWRRGELHVHAHSHGGSLHVHPHEHGALHARSVPHEHVHAHATLRSPRAAFGVGLVHGIGGSAPGGILMVAAAPDPARALAALFVFAAGTGLSMVIASGAAGVALSHGPIARRFGYVAPILGGGALAFGMWYALAGLSIVRMGSGVP
jgi:cytochrome c biogenesis protein CcdA